MVDVGRQSSTIPKSKETEKLEKSMTRLLLAKRKAMCHGAPLRLGLPCTKLKFYWLLGHWPE